MQPCESSLSCLEDARGYIAGDLNSNPMVAVLRQGLCGGMGWVVVDDDDVNDNDANGSTCKPPNNWTW